MLSHCGWCNFHFRSVNDALSFASSKVLRPPLGSLTWPAAAAANINIKRLPRLFLNHRHVGLVLCILEQRVARCVPLTAALSKYSTLWSSRHCESRCGLWSGLNHVSLPRTQQQQLPRKPTVAWTQKKEEKPPPFALKLLLWKPLNQYLFDGGFLVRHTDNPLIDSVWGISVQASEDHGRRLAPADLFRLYKHSP